MTEQTEMVKPARRNGVMGFVLPILAIALVGGTFLFIANGGNNADTQSYLVGQSGPAKLEPIADTGFNRIVLTERAAERLDIQTAPIRDQEVDGEQRMVVPYSAVIYGLNGETWAYISPEALTYHRAPISVDYIVGDLAVLTDGPDVGTLVVTVGVAELYGTDTGVGK